MANRPVFYVNDNNEIIKKLIDFDWSPGFAVSQKQKSIESLHSNASILLNLSKLSILEVSSKSKLEIGKSLSAFALKFNLNGLVRPVENFFQSSKCFEEGGPYLELLNLTPLDAKRDPRLKDSGLITSFYLDSFHWPIEPKTLFYDWLYLNAIHQNGKVKEEILNFSCFTDIEFNPKKSLNTQAFSAALYVSLTRKGLIEELLYDKANFIEYFQKGIVVQESLF